MSSVLKDLLPKPKNSLNSTQNYVSDVWNESASSQDSLSTTHSDWQPFKENSKTKKLPFYGNRKGWLPRSLEDFEDGGAFPEIHVAQYPLNMGRNVEKKQAMNLIPLQLDSEGKIQYDTLLKQGREDKIVYSKYEDLLPLAERKELEGSKMIDSEFERPSEEEIQKNMAQTKDALERILNDRMKVASLKNVPSSSSKVEYIQYTSAAKSEGLNQEKSHMIKLVERPVDPLEPAKFRHKRIPAAPPSPPPPIMHSPPRKVTVEEQKEWKIPPSISNWKNPKGYVIPLDKRLAADGRGLQEVEEKE